ncbi:MAG: class I SAM-dependent methyltransferase [Lachnospiraceae bacterium]|nr:class I SAM-dependent methyltransferase [Lachnospiraceae bacterium]
MTDLWVETKYPEYADEAGQLAQQLGLSFRMSEEVELSEYREVTIRPRREASGAGRSKEEKGADGLCLQLGPRGLALRKGDLELLGDLSEMLPRVRGRMWQHEPLARAVKLKNPPEVWKAWDATAGLGEDSMILAAAGYQVTMYEQNPVIAALLRDALRRAQGSDDAELRTITRRMKLICADSTEAMRKLAGKAAPTILYLDPMFPARQKSGLIKKKFQLLQLLESPEADEEAMLSAALRVGAARVVIKRPAKGPWMAGRKPDFSYPGTSIRYDCFSGKET